MLDIKRFLCCLKVIVLVCVLFSACKQNRSSASEDSRDIVDMKGRTVTIPKTVDKVFMDWAQGTLHMMTLGALDKVVAVRTAFEGEIFTWARTIYPNFDVVQKDDAPFMNIEALLAYEPDVIFSLSDEDSRNYENIGIPVVVVTFADYDEFKQAMRIIGDVLGGEYAIKATKFVDFFNANIALVSERLVDVDNADKKVIHYIQGRAETALRTQGYGGIESTWVELAGGKYAANDLIGRSIDISKEKFLQLDPDIILIGGHQQASSLQALMNDSTFSEMRAIRNGQVFRMPQGIFPWSEMGPEASMHMVWVAKLLFPDRFEDIDIAQMAKGFYLDFLGADISDEIIAQMQAGKLTPTGD